MSIKTWRFGGRTRLARPRLHAIDPMVVAAAAAARAVGDAKPKTRYVVGRGAKAQVFLRRIIPDRVLDGLVLGQIGLPQRAKTP